MIEKLLNYGNQFMSERMVSNSMLTRLLATSKDIEKSTRTIKKIYYAIWALLGIWLLYYLYCLWYLRAEMIGISVLGMIGALVSAVVFVISTNYEEFNFWNRKKMDLVAVVMYVVFTAISILSQLFCSIVLPVLFLIPISPEITTGMVVWLSRLCYTIFTAGLGGWLSYSLISTIFKEENLDTISGFKLRKVVDLRKDKEFSYDLQIIRRLEDGRKYVIKEKDRQRHMILSGVTGTGKTSSALIPAVASDLDHKAYNEDYAKKEIMMRMLSKDDVHPKKGMTDETFSMDSFWTDTEEGRKFLRDLELKAPSAGMTVIAPNADFADAVYDLATTRGFRVNRVDPIPADISRGTMKPGFKGFNPLYISPELSPNQRNIEVFRKARMFSDVLQALYDQSGKSDPYFTSLNRNMTTMVSILVLVTYPWLHNGEQPVVTDIQEVINDFSMVRKYIYALAKIVGVGDDLMSEKDITAENLAKRKFGQYQFIISQLSFDLLGAGRTKMEEQVRGLRIIINEFLTDPLIRNVLCSHDTVDIDRALAKGEITVVNYALELGMSIATGFGLFYCLSFNQAVLRRPGNEDSRLLHLYYCDEFPVLLHKDMESIFTLFRQFKTCFICAYQTSAQFDRTDQTRYLKNVVISNAGHHIVYGNCSKEDMELYEALAGKKLEWMEQKTTSETAITSSASMSFSTRTTPQYVNRVEGFKLRNKDFQEVTVFGVDNGDHVDPFEGKLSFLTKKQKEGKGRCHIDWEQFENEAEEEDATFKKTFVSVDGIGINMEEILKEADLSYLPNGYESVMKEHGKKSVAQPQAQEEEDEELEDLSDYA